MTHNPLIARFAGEPALVDPSMAERFQSCLTQAIAHPDFAQTMTAAEGGDFWPDADDTWGNRVRPYVIVDSVLQIPVKGVLLHDFPYALGSWATGYEYIWQAFRRGCGDFATGVIKGIALIVNSPGGMVAGCFDAVDKMVALKESVGVPVRGFAQEAAYSAGYGVISVADHINVSRTGGVGSIGVVTSHVDLSAAYKQAGIQITFIASDPSKVEGNATEPLSDEAKARIQARIDELYSIFVAAVARSRGLEESAIRKDLKAHCFTATQATSNGLADSVGSLEDAIAAFTADLNGTYDNNGDEEMTTNTTGTVTQAAHDTAVASARTEGAATAKTDERNRIKAIQSCDEAAKRGTFATHLAFNTDLSVDDAKAMLAAAAEEAPVAAAAAPVAPAAAAPAAPDFAAAMAGTPNPQVGADGNAVAAGGDDGASADPVLALVKAAGLSGFGATPAK